jgi:multiple sugar transport system substrate-binding protein
MRRRAALAGISIIVLVGTACTASGGSGGGNLSSPTPTGSHAPVTLTLWTFYTNPEYPKYNQILDTFEQKYPWITVKHVGGKSPQDILRAINSGTAPDVALEAGPDNVAKYCDSGAFVDLKPTIDAEHIDIAKIIPPAALDFTSYQGKQCALPVLSDAYGLYYNNKLFADAGISSPPKTFTELQADALKLTQYNPDGSIKVAGFVPLQNFYESYSMDMGMYNGATWYDSSGKSAFASDPKWAELLTWQKKFVDAIGYDKLQKFIGSIGGADSEWNAQQGFMKGEIAMTLDGEWRVAFIDDFKSNVDYSTAPFAVADDMASSYGLGQIGGDIIGIPRGSEHQQEAWLLTKWLATDTQAEVSLSRALKNVPTTFDSLNDPTLNADQHFSTFLKIFSNDGSTYKPITTLGTTDAELWAAFVDKYLAGNVPNLQAGLQQVAEQIDKQSQLG